MSGSCAGPPITPAMKVGELLEAYPQLEPVLIAQAPAFARLRNPILRRTVARVATLQQAAVVGGVGIRQLVEALRGAAGRTGDETLVEDGGAVFEAARPDWVSGGVVARVVDADALLAEGTVPLPVVVEEGRRLETGHLLRVDASFRPAPLVDALGKQGLRCWVHEAAPGRYEAYFGPRA